MIIYIAQLKEEKKENFFTYNNNLETGIVKKKKKKEFQEHAPRKSKSVTHRQHCLQNFHQFFWPSKTKFFEKKREEIQTGNFLILCATFERIKRRLFPCAPSLQFSLQLKNRKAAHQTESRHAGIAACRLLIVTRKNTEIKQRVKRHKSDSFCWD